MRMMFSNYTIEKYILKKAIILVDTREKGNEHIISWLDKKEIPHESRKLEYGDYGFYIPKNDEFGIYHDMMLDYAVERKASLEELSGNFTNDRERIENEFIRSSGRMDMIIENGSLDDILNGNYSTKYDKNSYIATLLTFMNRYNVHPHFIEKDKSPKLIYALLYYRLRTELKEG